MAAPQVCHKNNEGIKNPRPPLPEGGGEGVLITVRDGIKIFVYEYVPEREFISTIYIISGITGINHRNEKEIIERLSNNKNRVVVIHPRGTGYSEGKRGDDKDLSDMIGDYTEIILSDRSYKVGKRKNILFGHSMSCAIALKVAGKVPKTDGLILVNPPYKLKAAKGMTPRVTDYIRYALCYIFAPHVPIVNMAGDPSLIENEEDRIESEARNRDPLLVKYFSMHYMYESKKIMDGMVRNARLADYPLLLLYGDNDMIVEKEGCNEIYSAWKGQNKRYEIISGGSHGRSTVLRGSEIIMKWLGSL